MISDAPTAAIPSILVSVLGMEETQILKVLIRDPCDIQTIHFMTGIPLPCIENKIRALVSLGLAKNLHDGRFVCDDDSSLIDGLGSL